MNERITAIDLTEEVYLALKDFFDGDIKCGVNEIYLNFFNGQKFTVTINEK